jgi:peptidoglycan/LPS O-acetylase OafA/YrhL
MTTVSSSAARAQVQAMPKAASRNAALDRSRTFITVLVLIHHSVIAYTYFGHTDKQSFLGFDGVVLFNDSFFMAAMFFLSGLFVWPSLQRKGMEWFLRDRFWRLGLPFAVCALILMPVAYYAVSLRYHPEIGFTAFWWNTVTSGAWPSGPAWFVWVLLALDVIAAVVFRVAAASVEAIGRLSQAGFARPGLFFWALLIASIAVYVPAVLYFGASRWFATGPVAIQASRILLYLLYFFAGVGIGAVPFGQGLLAGNGGLARRWQVWFAATVVTYGCIIALIYVKHSVLPDVNHQPLWWEVAYALAFVSYSAAQTFNILALFLRFSNDGSSVLDSLRDSAYGIYLIHYVPVLWLQYALYDLSFSPVMQLTAVIKAIIVFILTLALSWAATAALRRIPGATRVL